MSRYILERHPSGSWSLFAPSTMGHGMLFLSFGNANWDAAAKRWSRPNPTDYEDAKRALAIMRGQSAPDGNPFLSSFERGG